MTTVMKKSGAESPDIIYSQGFRLANAGGNGGLTYLDYTERDEAVADELSPEEMFEDDELLSDLRNDPDLPEDFEGYLGYTDRDAAAKLENLIDSYQEKRYPTFSQGSYELTEAEHNRLINNLKTAQVNETVLWYGVISFSPEFIREAGLIDENNQVNQRAIKSAVMRSMPEMLQNEALDNNETFWWADIHLNTDHVHVHVAISQTENTRPEKDGQPLGMFSETTFRNFKAGIHRELSSDRSRSRVREIQQDLDQINKVLPGKAVEEARNNRQQMELLRRIQAALPNYKDKRRWRASNHSKEFQKAQKLTDELVDSLLDNQLKDEYTNFKQLVEERDQMYRQAYGQRIKDTTKAKDERLRTLIKNRIYRSLKDIADEVTPDDDRGKTKENNSDLMSRIEALGPEKNAQLLEAEQRRLKTLDPKSLEAKELKKVIGFRKFYIRRVNLDAEIDYHNHMYQELQKINSGSKKSEQEMQRFFLQAHQEQARLAWLKKQPHYMLKKQDPDGEFEAL
ncbi:relaxase MobL, partial [Limosilactobacillus fermentum]